MDTGIYISIHASLGRTPAGGQRTGGVVPVPVGGGGGGRNVRQGLRALSPGARHALACIDSHRAAAVPHRIAPEG